MGHHHNHNHLSASSVYQNKKLLWFCIILNIVFVAVEALAGVWSNSVGLLSDAGHNLSDVLGLLLAALAVHLAASSPDGKASNYIALCNSLLLLAVVVVIGIGSVDKILNPSPVNGNTIMLTAGIGIFINGITAFLLMRGQGKDINVKAAYLHAATDALVSLGVVVSGIIISLTGWAIIDGIISMAITLIIGIPTFKLFVQILHLLRKH